MAVVTSLASNAIGFLPYGKSGDRTLMGREDASETYVRGSVLILNGGRLAELAVDGVADIVGVAQRAATGTTDAEALYWPATPDMVFECTLEDDVVAGHPLAIADLYIDYAINQDDDGIHYADEDNNTNTAVVIVGVRDWQDMTDATVRSRVLVRFLHDVTIYDS